MDCYCDHHKSPLQRLPPVFRPLPSYFLLPNPGLFFKSDLPMDNPHSPLTILQLNAASLSMLGAVLRSLSQISRGRESVSFAIHPKTLAWRTGSRLPGALKLALGMLAVNFFFPTAELVQVRHEHFNLMAGRCPFNGNFMTAFGHNAFRACWSLRYDDCVTGGGCLGYLLVDIMGRIMRGRPGWCCAGGIFGAVVGGLCHQPLTGGFAARKRLEQLNLDFPPHRDEAEILRIKTSTAEKLAQMPWEYRRLRAWTTEWSFLKLH